MLAEGRMAKRKTGQPHKGWKAAARQAKIHDRQSRDLPTNARVAVVVVDDPYEIGGRIEVAATLRDDVLRHMRVRSEIDEAMYKAGRRYERYWEQSQLGSVKAMDTTKEPVDGGGGVPEPITDRQIDAQRQLSEAGRVLGRRGEALVRSILSERRKFKEVSHSVAERDIAYVRRAFVDCLNELAVFWNLAGRR